MVTAVTRTCIIHALNAASKRCRRADGYIQLDYTYMIDKYRQISHCIFWSEQSCNLFKTRSEGGSKASRTHGRELGRQEIDDYSIRSDRLTVSLEAIRC
ncbi:hypothetical protein RRG08_058511 [Elysia crispata]|uniref:Uncharacterized protein n=1 Tax=Elysia crispata TaxID=231223 RepID=A0AAE1DN05_9GAST|nr:hypothetical protein RRG08_058511 [Elysia crispata]